MNDILKNWVNDPDYIMEKVSRHNVSVTITLHPDGMASIDIYPYPPGRIVGIDEPSESCEACRIDIPVEDMYEAANCDNCRFGSNGECLLGGEPRIDGCDEFRTRTTCLTCRHSSPLRTTSIENGDLKVLCDLDEEFHYNSKPCNSWKGGTDE